ncbi:hypothetical protein EDB85DRAFT_2070585 [Lactarius pseudohatsudake]|nr:hypothetical protein EDB85DRAFT_2070585 [Lactarius pseudohatsudake]
MHRERIYAVKSWRKGPGRYDTIFFNADPSMEGMRGVEYPCALVHWFSCVGDSPDEQTGMWVVEPDHKSHVSIIHLDGIVRASHLLPVFGQGCVSTTLSFPNTLDTFTSFYVNKYVDHHAFEIAF